MKINANLRTILSLIFLVLALRIWEQFSTVYDDSTKLIGTLMITVMGVFVLVGVSRKWKGD